MPVCPSRPSERNSGLLPEPQLKILPPSGGSWYSTRANQTYFLLLGAPTKLQHQLPRRVWISLGGGMRPARSIVEPFPMIFLESPPPFVEPLLRATNPPENFARSLPLYPQEDRSAASGDLFRVFFVHIGLLWKPIWTAFSLNVNAPLRQSVTYLSQNNFSDFTSYKAL